MSNLLTDSLLADLMAAGQADVVVGLPTANHADTVGPLVRAVMEAFNGPFGRLRTVLLNPDAGSTDGTTEVVRAASGAADLMTTQTALRTIHRISAPYHGVPGRGAAVRVVFTAAELLGARAVVILDPAASSLTTDDVVLWIQAVIDAGADFVKPVFPRHPADGPLVTQLVRPLLRAAYGCKLSEPIDTQLACSGTFARRTRSAAFWGAPFADDGLDVFLTSWAMAGDFSLGQVATTTRGHPARERRPSTREVFDQILGALFACLAANLSSLSKHRKATRDVSVWGRLPAVDQAPPPLAVASYEQTFVSAADALKPVFAAVLAADVAEAIGAAAVCKPPGGLEDGLWAKIVFDFLGAASRCALPMEQLTTALEPLYLGRVAKETPALAGLDVEAGERRLEALAVVFEQRMPQLLASIDGENGT